MTNKTIWWGLATVACWAMVFTIVAYVAWGVVYVSADSPWSPPDVLIIPISFLLATPKLYLAGFSLWHWKFHYRGANPVAWAVAFAIVWSDAFCAAPLAWTHAVSSAGEYALVLLYYAFHIHRDLRGIRPYGTANSPAERSIIPGRYGTFAQAFRGIGIMLLGWALFTSIIGTATYWTIFDSFDRCATRNIGKTLSAEEVDAIHSAHFINEVMVGVLCVAAITGALGGCLLAMSHNIRWRLKEQEQLITPPHPQGEPSDAPGAIGRSAPPPSVVATGERWRWVQTMQPEIETLCDFLAQLQNGAIEGDDARARLSNLFVLKTPGLEELFGNLHHYIADADIRAKDLVYRELQDSEMTILISRLRSGDIAKANQVTFLGRACAHPSGS